MKNSGYYKPVLKLGLIIGLVFGVMSSGVVYAVPDCSVSVDKYIPDPYDCSHFYKCANGTPIHLECPPGTEFDKSMSICNLPQDANCEALPKPSS